ncbi:hypothetical protein AVEN_71161-1 [Araneus ventricosus]|uniref:RNase H type-1 domain-containing protein n=1 Tax=Araneus ventricosus TaxID=182803 RepID=A0A4Y2MUE5_ARAVE|nr:hypothetical protein AVEN_71161-1 [Araneus ventricosus]
MGVWKEQNIIYRCSAKQQDYNIVSQAELLALKYAKDHAISLPHQPIAILVDNQARVQAAVNPRSRNTTARDICKSLIIYIFLGSNLTWATTETKRRIDW